MTKPKPSKPRKRPAREIDAQRNRAQRRQAQELAERAARRRPYPQLEEDGAYKP